MSLSYYYCSSCDEEASVRADPHHCNACNSKLCEPCRALSAQDAEAEGSQVAMGRLRAELDQMRRDLDRECSVRTEAKRLSEARVAAARTEAERLRLLLEAARVSGAHAGEGSGEQQPRAGGGGALPAKPQQRAGGSAASPPLQQPGSPEAREGRAGSGAADSPAAHSNAADLELELRRESFQKGSHHQTNCALCSSYYTILKREHHCRSCYLSVCSDCSGVKGSGAQRYCDMCTVSHSLSLPYWSKIIPANSGQWVQRLRALADTIAENEANKASGAASPEGATECAG